MNASMLPHRLRIPLAAAATAAALCLCSYLPALRGPFVFDDIFEIESNPAIKWPWNPSRAMVSPGGFPSRPISYFTFALSRAIHGLDPLGWHLTNLAIHLVNGGLVWLVISRLPRLHASPGEAWAAATVWLLHPLCTQPVAYNYQRSVATRPLAAYAIIAFLVLLAPSSSIIPVNGICVEHRMYVPLVVPVTAVTVGAGRLVARLHHGSTLRALLLAIVLAAEVTVSSARTTVYGSMIALWSDTVAKVPRNQRALLWKGIALSDAGRNADAFAAFAATIEADPNNPACARAHAFRAAMLGRVGDYAGALGEANRAVALDPEDSIGWHNLAHALRAVGLLGDAAAAAEKAVDGRRR